MLRRLARIATAVALVTVGSGACATGVNYTSPTEPRYAGGRVIDPPTAHPPDTLTFVTFNVEYGERIDSALSIFANEPDLGRADVVFLQEVDAPGTERIAGLLGMEWVYYPARYRPSTERDFGNAILSRWPIESDAKLMLPHVPNLGRNRRIATAATIRVGARRVRAYSVHLGTPLALPEWKRMEQLSAVVEDARGHRFALIGGDFNGGGRIARVATRAGFDWPSQEGPKTILWGRWDHILTRGFQPAAEPVTGTIDSRSASDHAVVWARAVLAGR